MEAHSENSAPDESKHLEVAHVFRFFGERYRQQVNPPTHTRRIIENIEFCRTSLMGSHSLRCNQCSYQKGGSNSCKDRHCPKCQSMKKAEWLEDRKRDLLPVGYLHNVFTLPHELNALILCNKEVLLKNLFKSASETLKQFGLDPRWGLKGQLGFTMVLHTWDQKLNSHYHLHAIIAAGAISKETSLWVSAKKKKCKKEGFRKDYLFSVHALSPVFREKFLAALKESYQQGELQFKGEAQMFERESFFLELIDSLYRKSWVLYSKRPFKGVKHVFEYLARYSHRIAISNDRMVSLKNGEVTFKWKDRSDGHKPKLETISADLFIKKFLFHELDSGFHRIRHYGFLSSGHKKKKLANIRQQLKVPLKSITEKMTKKALLKKILGEDYNKCPECKVGELQYRMGLNRWELLSMFNLPRTYHEYLKLKPEKMLNST